MNNQNNLLWNLLLPGQHNMPRNKDLKATAPAHSSALASRKHDSQLSQRATRCHFAAACTYLSFKYETFTFLIACKSYQRPALRGQRSLNQFTGRVYPLPTLFSSLWDCHELRVIYPNLSITHSCLLAICLNKLCPVAVKLHGQSFLAVCDSSPKSQGIAPVSHSDDISFINSHKLD